MFNETKDYKRSMILLHHITKENNNKMNNPYIGIAHIDYVKKDTPPYYGLHETGSRSISYDDFFKVK